MPDSGHGQPDRLRSDDTVEIAADPSLTDDLLHADSPHSADSTATPPEELEADNGDDEYVEHHRQQRSRVTSALLVALIFALGTLTGVLAGRILTPAPPPQIVYVLDDPGITAPTPTPTTPSASR